MIAPALPSMSFPDSSPSCGGVLVTLDGKPLPLTAASVRADACAGLARVVLAQTFTNPHPLPLHVTYRMPLPADGAVSGYRFVVGSRVIEGEVDRKDRARERFEQAIVEGHTAALLEQDRSSVFTQEIGNLPPGETLTVELVIDQVLAWIGDTTGGWEWRFPTVVAPRYSSGRADEHGGGGPTRVADAARVSVETTTDPLPITLSLALVIRDAITQEKPDSPSHALAITAANGSSTTVGLAGTATLDRDLVVRWSVAAPDVGVAIDAARPGAGHAREGEAFGLLTIVPPRADAHRPKLPRDLVVLLDTSGSMGGVPLDQARRLVGALVDRLDEHDRLEMIEFSTQPRRWMKQPVFADAGNRAKAHAWLRSLQASGGTEMRTGILEALASLRAEAQRQVVLITDGLIGFESEVVAEIHRRLPAGSRVHTVGVGSAVNRSLTLPAARAGRGSETIVAIDEDPERAIARVLARTSAPTVVDLVLSGDALVEHAPQHLPDLMAGAPCRVAVRLSPRGGTLHIAGRTHDGLRARSITVPPCQHGTGNQAVVALFGRERVEDLEMIRAAGEASPAIDQEIASIGLEFQISTRLTSWVAIDRERSVDPRTPTRHESVPQALPHGTSVAGFGLRPAAPPMPMQYAVVNAAAPMAGPMGAPASAKSKAGSILDGAARAIGGLFGGRASPPPPQAPSAPPKPRPSMARESKKAESSREERAQADAPEPADLFEQGTQTRTGVRFHRFADPTEIAGSVHVLADGTLVVEIEVPPSGLEWDAPSEVELELDDGRRIVVAVDPARTTLAGTHPTGTRLRLALPNAASFGTVTAIHVGGAAPLVIRV
jgi:Ca-activated chloride channel family protein